MGPANDCDYSSNYIGKVDPRSQKYVPKGYGSETWLWNGNDYCGKILFVKSGRRNSYHYHKLKDEVFYVQSGCILIEYSWGDNPDEANSMFLQPGDTFHLPVGLRHRFTGLEDSHIIEFSTHHEDSDSYRLVPGD